MNETLYMKIIDSLVEDGYIVINDALGEELRASLLADAKSENDFKRAGISGAGDLHLDASKRRDKISWLDKRSEAEMAFSKFSDGLRERLNRELYLGLSYYESHFAIYDKGDFYEKHLDAFKNSKNRVVTTVYYLNEEWDESDGGELLVYNKHDELITSLLPKGDTLVVFMSEDFPHEVKKTNKKRYSIAGWFRIDK